VLGADQTAGPQWMLGQPIVAGALGGALAGEPGLGFTVGLWGQLAWNGAAPVGARPHPDVSGGTLAGVLAGASLLPGESPSRAALAGILVCLLTGWAGIWPVWLNRRWNAGWTRWVRAAQGEPAQARRGAAAQRLAWLGTAALSGAWVLVGAAAGARLSSSLLAWVPASGGAGGALPALAWGLGLGAAALAFGRGGRRDWLWVAGGAAVAAAARLARAF